MPHSLRWANLVVVLLRDTSLILGCPVHVARWRWGSCESVFNERAYWPWIKKVMVDSVLYVSKHVTANWYVLGRYPFPKRLVEENSLLQYVVLLSYWGFTPPEWYIKKLDKSFRLLICWLSPKTLQNQVSSMPTVQCVSPRSDSSSPPSHIFAVLYNFVFGWWGVKIVICITVETKPCWSPTTKLAFVERLGRRHASLASEYTWNVKGVLPHCHPGYSSQYASHVFRGGTSFKASPVRHDRENHVRHKSPQNLSVANTELPKVII